MTYCYKDPVTNNNSDGEQDRDTSQRDNQPDSENNQTEENRDQQSTHSNSQPEPQCAQFSNSDSVDDSDLGARTPDSNSNSNDDSDSAKIDINSTTNDDSNEDSDFPSSNSGASLNLEDMGGEGSEGDVEEIVIQEGAEQHWLWYERQENEEDYEVRNKQVGLEFNSNSYIFLEYFCNFYSEVHMCVILNFL